MIRVVSWNIAKREAPWNVLEEMARGGEADVALLQEAWTPPPDSAHPVPYGSEEFWRHQHVARHALLTPRNPARSIDYRVDRLQTCAPINRRRWHPRVWRR